MLGIPLFAADTPAATAARARIVTALTADDFLTVHHQAIFRAHAAMHEADETPTVNGLAARLDADGELGAVGGLAYLIQLFDEATVPAALEDYLARVRHMAGLRRTIDVCELAILHAQDGRPPAEIAASTVELLGKITERADDAGERKRTGPRPLRDVMRDLGHALESPESDFLACPFPGINDRLSGGLARAELLALGGRPGVAKSAFVLQWALHAARTGQRGLFVSCEMTDVAMARRALAQVSGVSASVLRRHALGDRDWVDISTAMGGLYDLPLDIDDTTDTLAGIRRAVRAKGYRFVVVDYLQLVRSPSDAAAGKRLEVSAVIQGLKRLARREQCSVIALSSLTRLSVERGKVQRPDADKLKESGDIEHAADVVLILHWPNTEESERELIFAKVREGESGGKAMMLDFYPPTVKFVVPDAAPREEQVPF